MSIQTVTTIISNPDTAHDQIDGALTVARAQDAHLQVVVMTLGFDQLGVVQGGLEAMPQDPGLQDAQNLARTLTDTVKARLARDDVRWDIEALATVPANINHQVMRHTRFSDLVVQTRPTEKASAETALRIAEAVLFDAECPLMVLPAATAQFDPGGMILIGWDGSSAALRAARLAMPILQKARKVHIALVDPVTDANGTDDPGGDFARYLARHDVDCEITVLARGSGGVADTLAQHARETGCELVVMGAYGHSRLRQMLFGGTTRHMLSQAQVPILLAH